jgi:hypothetical protein
MARAMCQSTVRSSGQGSADTLPKPGKRMGERGGMAMTKVRSGLVLIGIGVLLNILGRVAIVALRQQRNVGIAGLLFLIMLGSVVIGIFGIVRLVSGLIRKS